MLQRIAQSCFKFVVSETIHCTRKPLLTVSARIMLIHKQLSRSVNYLSQSCQQPSIQPIRSWYQELVSWNGGINKMSTGSPALSLLTRPLSARPANPRLHSAISPQTQPDREPVRRLALFLRLGLPSTLIHHENGAFRKWKRSRCRVLVWTEDVNHVIFPQTQIQNEPITVSVLKFIQHSVDGKRFTRF